MPSEQRREEVRGAEDVEAAAEDGACDAVQPGRVPGYLRAVDAEVRGYGTFQALGGEDAVGVGGFGGGCLGG